MPGGWEWVVLALVALVLFGGSKLAGIGKNAGRAIREFKEETDGLRKDSANGATSQSGGELPAQPTPPPTDSEPPQGEAR